MRHTFHVHDHGTDAAFSEGRPSDCGAGRWTRMHWRRITRTLAALSSAVVATAVVIPARAHAQHPVVLVHGINSDFTTWNKMNAAIDASGANVRVIRTSTTDGARLVGQTNQLYNFLSSSGAVSNSPAVVAHSQGGLIGRVLSRIIPVDALITVGTPHYGAPLADNPGYPGQQLQVANYLGNVALYTLTDVDPDGGVYNSAFAIYPLAILLNAANAGFNVFGTQFIDNHGQALDDLSPATSQLLPDLNNNAWREQVPTEGRISVGAYLEPSGYANLPWRAVMPAGLAQVTGNGTRVAAAIALDVSDQYYNAATNLYYDGDYEGAAAYGAVAGDFGVVASYLSNIPSAWNAYIGDPTLNGNDGVVPLDRMRMPNNGGQSYLLGGVSHTEETGAPAFTDYVSRYLVSTYGTSQVSPPPPPPTDPTPIDPSCPPPQLDCGIVYSVPGGQNATSGVMIGQSWSTWPGTSRTPTAGLRAAVQMRFPTGAAAGIR